jgi:hypothetical protein
LFLLPKSSFGEHKIALLFSPTRAIALIYDFHAIFDRGSKVRRLCSPPAWRTKMAQFRTHYLTKERSYVSTQQSGYFSIDTEMISKNFKVKNKNFVFIFKLKGQ